MAVVGITIRIADAAGDCHALPYLSASATPSFEWDIPARCQQIHYIFELRAANGTTYSSGRVESTIPRHAVTTPLQLAIWAGLVECRLRLYNALDELDATTHYFANGSPLWESDEDSLYFLREHCGKLLSTT